MLNRQMKQNIQKLDKEIGAHLDILNDLLADDPQYVKTMDTVEQLLERREKLTSMSRPKRQTTLNDWMPVIATVGGAVVIGLIEAHGHTFTSKAAMLLPKPRL